MPDYSDFDYEADEQGAPELPPRERPIGVIILGALLIVAAGIAAYFVFANRPTPTTVAESTEQPAFAPEPAPPLGTTPEPVVVPPLGESDPLVREMMRKLSSNPRIAAWLATDGLIRNFTVAVSNIAEGTTPAKHVSVLAPSSGFTVIERDEYLFVDPASYKRYDAIADAIAAMDPDGLATLYTTLKPRIQEAYGELGFPDASFDRALERAIVQLLNTPVTDDMVRVEPKGIGYAYADERLENLTPAQKQLLRFGPRNVRLIQRALRQVGEKLGIPPGRLPAPRASLEWRGPQWDRTETTGLAPLTA